MEKIGVCDWGIGGIGVLQQLQKLGNYHIVYFSDAGFTPYGKVADAGLRMRWQEVQSFFKSQGVSKIVIACNALSTVVNSTENIFTVIDSGVDLILKKNLTEVGVTGGYRTIESLAYKTPLEQKGVKVTQSIGQVLSARIEAGDLESEGTMNDIQNVFYPFERMKDVVLACTHYPVLESQIKSIYPNLLLHDPAQSLAEKVHSLWKVEEVKNKVDWFTTGNYETMIDSARICFGQEILNLKTIDL